MAHPEVMERSADISPCGRYRYALWRQWAPSGKVVAFVGLNPSTADAELDDPTIRRCVGFAKAWGYGSLLMLNLFAIRATDPAAIRREPFPVGPSNDKHLRNGSRLADLMVAAWGVNGRYKNRDTCVRAMLPSLHYLRLTKDGHPSHPLYLPAYLRPVLWVEPDGPRDRPRSEAEACP